MEMDRDLEQAIPSILIVKQPWLRSTALETEEMAQRVEIMQCFHEGQSLNPQNSYTARPKA